MNTIRVKLWTHVLLVIGSIVVSSLAVAASANWIHPASETPAYVVLAKQNIQDNKNESLSRDTNITRISN